MAENHLWNQGGVEWVKQLDGEERETLAPLEEALKTGADSDTRENLEKRIALVKAEYKQKRKDADQSLF